jgi:membrane-associated protein
MPFLPGDSLLFAAGAISALPETNLNTLLLFGLLATAAILGDTVNYWIGHYVGPKVFTTGSRFFKKEHLERTQAFYDKHGGKTIFLARFIPNHPHLCPVRRRDRQDALRLLRQL